MEKLTINRIGEPKTIMFTNKKSGQPDSFQKVGIQVNEYPERWFDFTFRGNHGLTVGQGYDFETASREYNGKTYWDAKFPKGAPRGGSGGGMSDDDRATMRRIDANTIATNTTVLDMKAVLSNILRNLELSGSYKEHTSEGTRVPDFETVSLGAMGGTGTVGRVATNDEPPLSAYEDEA